MYYQILGPNNGKNQLLVHLHDGPFTSEQPH
jgi:hypothetical protein